MKVLRLVLLLLVVSPGTALASGTTLASQDVRPGVNRPAHRFNLVGLHWKGSGAVSFRTRTVGGRWTGWRSAAPEDDGPDAPARGWRLGNPYWVGPSNRLQVRTFGGVNRVRAYYIWSPRRNTRLRTVSKAGSPLVITRAS